MTNGDHANTIVSIRVFDVPRERIFEAWTTPELLAKWWGPNGFTNTFREFDLRPGGHWRFIMHGPDGTDYDNHIVFVEIAPQERIVLDHLGDMHAFRVTATFEALDEGRTRVTFRQRFESAEEYERVRKFAEPANEQNFDRMGALLAERGE